jgi:7-cyano-7-deazaguanine synthase
MSVARRTAILLSGGIDSIALAHWKRPELAITVNYGQVPALAEMDASRAVARDLGLEHEIVSVDCSPIGSGDLAGSTPHDAAPASDWWPYRNQLLITIGAARALACGASRMLIGTVASDHFHADGRPEFIALMADVLRLQEGSLDLEAPARQCRLRNWCECRACRSRSLRGRIHATSRILPVVDVGVA